MANTPKKVKDPTEVALSAIQEALNISEQGAENRSPLNDGAAPPSLPPATPDFSATSFEPRANADRAVFEPIEEPRNQRRAANDDRASIGQMLQEVQRGRPSLNTYTLFAICSGVWLLGCAILTVAVWPSLQSAMAQGTGVLVLAGLAALFIAPVLLFFFVSTLAAYGQNMNKIAQSMAQVAMRFSEPEHAASDSMVTVGQAIRREVAAMGDGVEGARPGGAGRGAPVPTAGAARGPRE